MNYKSLMIGAMLHDIGKLVQRAMPGIGNHSVRGADYLKNYFNKDVLDCVKYHHSADLSKANLFEDSLAFIVYEADNISAGMDRRETAEDVNQKFDSTQALHNIFNVVKEIDSDFKSVFPLQAFKEDDDIHLPVNNTTVTPQKYEYVLNDFSDGLKQHNDNDSVNSLLKLIEATLAYVPSSTSQEELPDISLYDHSKLTAAISGCLFNYYKSNFKYHCFTNTKETRNNNAFILVSADISGIQKFIYTISSKGALKSLRGRSFYLEMLVENIVDEILDGCGLCRANLLYSGGGHFYMLLPNTDEVKNLLDTAKIKLNNWFIKNYGVALYIELSYIEVSANSLANEMDKKVKTQNSIGKLYKDVGSKNSQGKVKRYSKEQLLTLTVPKDNLDGARECSICKCSTKELKTFNGKSFICSNCNGVMGLGEKLSNVDDEVVVITDIGELEIPTLNSRAYIDIVSRNSAEELLKKGRVNRIYSINRNMMGENYSTNLWAGTYASAKSFEELSNKSTGVKRLAVLRADVDNLGMTFIKGFELPGDKKYQYVSFSRNSKLSYSLSLFFKYEINKICKGKGIDRFTLPGTITQDEKDVAIVYAGGDDVFIVGAWNQIIELAVDLNNALCDLTNGKLSISAGIGIYDHKFPINQMANLTGELEAYSKSQGKDRITLFNDQHCYKWGDFVESVCEEKMASILDWFTFEEEPDKRKMPIGMSMIYKLIAIIRKIIEKKEINIARLAYAIGRLQPSSNNQSQMAKYEEFKNNFMKWALSESDLKELETALTLIVYLKREGK